MPIFDKYQDLMGPLPNGRPVGVRDGFGQQPNQMMNPALAGLTHTGLAIGPAPMDFSRNSGSGQPGIPQQGGRLINGPGGENPGAARAKRYANPMNDPNSPRYWGNKPQAQMQVDQLRQTMAQPGQGASSLPLPSVQSATAPLPLPAQRQQIDAQFGGVAAPTSYLDLLRQQLGRASY